MRASSRMASTWSPCCSRKARISGSAASRSPSTNSEVAVTTSRGRFSQRRHVAGGHGALLRIPGHAVQALEHAPARGQRMVEVHRGQKGLDGRRRLPHDDVAMAALLVQAAEARIAAARAPPGRRGPRRSGRGGAARMAANSRASRCAGRARTAPGRRPAPRRTSPAAAAPRICASSLGQWSGLRCG